MEYDRKHSRLLDQLSLKLLKPRESTSNMISQVQEQEKEVYNEGKLYFFLDLHIYKDLYVRTYLLWDIGEGPSDKL